MKRPWVRSGLVVLAAVAVGLVVWLVVRDKGTNDNAATKAPASSTADVGAKTLKALTAALGRPASSPVYWAGEQRGVTYEFTETQDRRVYVRYLPKGVAAGSTHPYLTIASYPFASAYAATRDAAGKANSVAVPVPGGGFAFYNRDRPTNVYLAYPGKNVQVEVYSPSATTAQKLVTTGAIRQVDQPGASVPAVTTGPTLTSAAALRHLAGTVGHPIYWLGQRSGTRLELTRTPDGRVYLRYLHAGVAPGSTKAFLSVASYPLSNALAATKEAAAGQDAVRIPLSGGAVAFYSKAHPTNVYLAFPGADTQVELFDPSARLAHTLADRIQPVG